MTKVVIITGASRGIGRGLVSHYLLQPATTVIAGVRNPNSEESRALRALLPSEGSRLVIVQLDSRSTADVESAIRDLHSKFGITHIDIAIANAGICDHLKPVSEIDLGELQRHVDVNTYGVLRLFQTTWPLLQKSSAPRFVLISSEQGSMAFTSSNAAATGAYGLSKAAANFLVTKIGAENQNLVAFSIDPGLVQTEMGNRGAKFAGLGDAPQTIIQSVEGIAREIDNATRKQNHGSFRSYDGRTIQW